MCTALPAALLLAACGGGGGGGTSTGPSDTLVVAIGADPAALNPDTTAAVPDILVGCMVYQGLVAVDGNNEPVPELAESWTVNEAGTKYTFNLVEAQWHDGKPFTSADVAYTLTEVSAELGPFFAAAGAAIKSIDTPDERTVVIRLRHPYGPFLTSLSCSGNGAILPAHLFEGTDVLQNEASLSAPVGTGPYKLTGWSRGSEITLERNPDYWRADSPELEGVVVRIVPGGPQRTLSLRTGEIHFVPPYYLPATDVASLRQTDSIQVVEVPGDGQQSVNLNVRREPVNRPEVRQALYMAIDRDFLLESVYSGQGTVSRTFFPEIFEWANDPGIDLMELYPHDPQRANELLDEAGLPPGPDGTRFSVDFVVDSENTSYVQTAQAIAAMWEDVGVAAEVIAQQRLTELETVFTRYEFDATTVSYAASGDPNGLARLYITSAINGQPFQNASGYSNSQVDQLFEEGLAHPELTDRSPYYHEIGQVLSNDLPSLPLVEAAQIGAAVSWLDGVESVASFRSLQWDLLSIAS